MNKKTQNVAELKKRVMSELRCNAGQGITTRGNAAGAAGCIGGTAMGIWLGWLAAHANGAEFDASRYMWPIVALMVAGFLLASKVMAEIDTRRTYGNLNSLKAGKIVDNRAGAQLARMVSPRALRSISAMDSGFFDAALAGHMKNMPFWFVDEVLMGHLGNNINDYPRAVAALGLENMSPYVKNMYALHMASNRR